MTELPDWLATATRSRANSFAQQLRSGVSGDAPVPNLDWSVTVLAQHVASLPHFWDAQHRLGTGFEMPDDFAAYAAESRTHIDATEPVLLADQIESGYAVWVDGLLAADSRRYLYGNEVTTANMCAFAINELVLHGRDLAAVTGADTPRHTRDEANASVEAMLLTTPTFVDPAKAAAQPDGTYHVAFRGGKHYTWTKTGPALTISEGKPKKATAHLNTDPEMFLLSSLGRVGQVRAAMSGKMVTYGLRPWRFLGLGNVAMDGI